MDPQRTRQQTQDESGFTIVELLVVSVLALVVVMSAYQLLMSQSRLLSAHSEMIDARESSRGAAFAVAWKLIDARVYPAPRFGAPSPVTPRPPSDAAAP